MKRANQLQPLSRQHHLGLHISSHAKNCSEDPIDIAEHWQALSAYMENNHKHFSFEDNLLIEGLSAYKKTNAEVDNTLRELATQHQSLHQQLLRIKAVQSDEVEAITVAQITQFANTLYNHIRFEERELLPLIERYLLKDELDAIYKASPDAIKHLDQQR